MSWGGKPQWSSAYGTFDPGLIGEANESPRATIERKVAAAYRNDVMVLVVRLTPIERFSRLSSDQVRCQVWLGLNWNSLEDCAPGCNPAKTVRIILQCIHAR